MKIKILVMIAAIIVVPACADSDQGPIYMDCYVSTSNDGKRNFSLTIDESSMSITHIYNRKTVYSKKTDFNTEGFFSVNKIFYKLRLRSGSSWTTTGEYEIDRGSLEIKEIIQSKKNLTGRVNLKNKGNGYCSIAKPKKRKI